MNPENPQFLAAERSPLHPDVEAGLQALVHEEIPRKIGMASGYGVGQAAKNFAESLRAAGADLTAEGKQHFGVEVAQKIQENLSTGLQFAIEGAIRYTGLGLSAATHLGDIHDLCVLARELSIPIHFVPSASEGIADADSLLVPLSTEEEIMAYCHDQIERNLLQGIKGNLELFSYSVNDGKITRESFDEDIEKWYGVLEQSGYTIIDRPSVILAEEKGAALVETQAVLSREINKQDVQALKESLLSNGLMKGIESIFTTVKREIQSGASNPLELYTSNMSRYIEEAKKRDLVDETLALPVHEGKCNPSLFDGEIASIVRRELPNGLEGLVAKVNTFMEEGMQPSMIEYYKKIVESYFTIADTYGVIIDNKQEVLNFIDSLLSEKNLQAAVNECLEKAKQWVRSGDFNLAQYQVNRVDEVRKVAHEKGFAVDFSVFDAYTEQVKIGAPRLQ